MIRTLAAFALAMSVVSPVFAQAPPQPPVGRTPGVQRLTPQERRSIRRGAAVRRARRVRRAFSRMDIDGNGAISRQEWRRRPDVFDRLDLNKDGQLTREELRAGRRRAIR